MNCAHGRGKLSKADTIQLWARAGGACAICGADLLKDVRTSQRIHWGELAHIIGAEPSAARGDSVLSKKLETDPDNLVLLCPSCHTKVDRDAARYTVELLQQYKARLETSVRLAASQPASAQVLPIVMTSVIANTPNKVNDDVIAAALQQSGLVAGRDAPITIGPINPTQFGGRVAAYWEQHARELRFNLFAQLESRSAHRGSLDAIAFFGRADMPSLMAAGMILGNRNRLHVFQPKRSDGSWTWPQVDAKPPEFRWNDPKQLQGEGPIALVFSLSVRVPHRDVIAAFPVATPPRIVEFTVEHPEFELVKGPRVGTAFHDAVRQCVGEIELLLGPDRVLHVFPAMPASLATHFGSAMTLNFMPKLRIYDRDNQKKFAQALVLPDDIEDKNRTL